MKTQVPCIQCGKLKTFIKNRDICRSCARIKALKEGALMPTNKGMTWTPKESKFFRKCSMSQCENELGYTTKRQLEFSIKKNPKAKCKSCAARSVADQISATLKSKADMYRPQQRLSALKRIEERCKLTGKRMIANFNIEACDYFNKLMVETNTYIQHALNGGEFHIKELGYWVDGYDKENNIVYEYYEPAHFYNDKVMERDARRQKEIEEFLKCKFIVIDSRII